MATGNGWELMERDPKAEITASAPVGRAPKTVFRGKQRAKTTDRSMLGNLEVNRSVSAIVHMTLHMVARDGRCDLLDVCLKVCTQDKIDALDKDGFAALHYAARFNRTEITTRLLKAHCNPNVRTKEGLTPLHFAARHLPRTFTVVIGATDAQSTSREVIHMLLQADGKIIGDQVIDHKAKDNQGVTPLHMACSRGNVPAVQELVAYMKDVDEDAVNAQDNHKDTPLHEACIRGNLTIVKELLNHGADVGIKNADDEIPLHTACKEGFVEIVKAILHVNQEGAQDLLKACDNEFNTPMHFAVESGDLETVKFLLESKAEPSRPNGAKAVPIHIAAAQGYVEIAKKLLESDDSCKDFQDKQQQTPLHYAARANQVDMIKFLISKQCNKDASDNDAVSPLLLAVIWGRAEAVETLIDGGCEVNTTDKDGRSAVYWAAQEGHMEVLRIFLDHKEGIQLCSVTELYHHNTPLHVAARMGKTQVFKLLVTRSAEQLCHASPSEDVMVPREEIDVNDPVARERLRSLQQVKDDRENMKLKVEHLDFRNDENKTPLHLAAMFGNMDVIRFLVHKYPPTLTDEDENGNTPLHLASCHGRTEVVDFLIKEGADVDARNSHLCTPLGLASDKGHVEVISLLIKADATLETKDKSCKTPLYQACESGHLSAVNVLLENEADVTALNEHMNLNCLGVAVEKGHKNVALAIIHSKKWEAALRHSDGQKTPFRRMIALMPSVAKAVLDRCMDLRKVAVKQESPADGRNSNDTVQYEVELNYEFLDDYCDKGFGHSSMPVTSDDSIIVDVEKNKGFIAKWGPKGFSRKNHPLALMVLYSHTDLLRHPMVSSLLDYKWSKYGRAIFVVNLITYLIFLFFLTLYALLLPHPDQAFCHDFSVTQSIGSLPVNGTVCPFESASTNRSKAYNFLQYPTGPMNNHAHITLYVAAVVVIISAAIRLLVELVQFAKRRYHYFLTVENYIELGAYSLSIIFVIKFGHNCWCPTNWQWQLGSISVFLAWINFILFLKRVPLLGIYVLMFNNILYTFMKFALIAFLFIFAFCLSFYMILYKAPNDTTLLVNVSPFRNAGLSFVKTMVMTIGEFEYDSLFGHNCECTSLTTSFPEVGYALWIIFLIVMPILLNNLLVGLAVDDTKAIQDQALLNKLSLQIDVTLDAEELLPKLLRRRCIKRKRLVKLKQMLGRWKRFREDLWGKEHWDSVDILKKHMWHMEVSPIEQIQDQTGELSREVKKLQNEMIELMKKNNDIMEKNNRMEQLLVMLAKKQGIYLDSEEPERQE